MMQNLYKNDSWFQKSHEEFEQLQTTRGRSKKLKFDGPLLSKKYILPAKTLNTEDLSNITFNYLCEHSLNSLVIFETMSQFSRHNYVFKVQIFRLYTARVKIHQIPHIIFQTKNQFFLKLLCHER